MDSIRNGFTARGIARRLLWASILGVAGTAYAQAPSHLDKAVNTPWVETLVEAYHSYNGLRWTGSSNSALPCGASNSWCYDYYYRDSSSHSDDSETADRALSERAAGSDNARELDSAHAQSWAKTSYGANHAKVSSDGNYGFSYRLLDASGNVAVEADGITNAGAFASSVYNDPFVVTGSGFASFQFKLEREPEPPCVGACGGLGLVNPPLTSITRPDSDVYGNFWVMLYDLTAPHIDYCSPWNGDEGGQPDCVSGPVLVGDAWTGLPATPGVEVFTFGADLQDGSEYALIVGLFMSTTGDVYFDMYNTASLDAILAQPGMSLAFKSGNAYAGTAVPEPQTVSEPQTHAMLLAGLGWLAFAARRRRL